MRCPICDLAFVIAFDSRDRLEDTAVRIDCPRVEDGNPCGGFVLTHLPTRYRVLPAVESR
jgi:hypothetical protein